MPAHLELIRPRAGMKPAPTYALCYDSGTFVSFETVSEPRPYDENLSGGDYETVSEAIPGGVRVPSVVIPAYAV
jgi:hypothetical protein